MSRKMLGSYLVVGLALICAPLAGSSPDKVSSDFQAPPPSSSGGTLTGTMSDPTGAYLPPNDYLKFTITGADLKRAATRELSYGGTPSGNTIVLSGEMSVARAQGSVSNVSMDARLGTKTFRWAGEVRGQTVTRSFNLTFRIGADTPDPAGGGTYVSGAASLNVCGGICAGYSVGFIISFKKPPTPPVKPPTPPVKPTQPKKPAVGWPIVHAYPVAAPWPLRPATYAWLPYTVNDASAKAKVYGTLYEGGSSVLTGGTKYFIVADGRKWQWKARLAADLTGPLRFCVWAVNPSGKKSVLEPKSSCAWLSLLVDIDRVSNGCGGKGFDMADGWDEAVENTFGNEHTYKDSNVNPLAKSYTVNFKDACDLHDAGYAGVTVEDKINGGPPIDFRTWTRKRVDEKFWSDMKKLCDAQIRKQEPPGVTATVALTKCKGLGGPASIGSKLLYRTVRVAGSLFFDADLTRPGHQASGHRNNS